jgi:D-alanyl-D-alanine carboxypeptidase
VKVKLIIAVALIVCGVIVYFIVPKKVIKLLSPLGFDNSQDEKISKKIDSTLKLDFFASKELAPLDLVPRYIVYNSKTGHVYFSKNSQHKISPASFTKLLSAQVALDLAKTDLEIEVHPESLNKVPTILDLKVGEKFLLGDILRASIATSANDAAQVLADEAARSVEITSQEFVYYMNKKATLLGMKSSHFVNPDGLDDQNQYSTIQDIARLVSNVQKNYPEILQVAVSDNEDIATSSAHGHYYLPNWNGLLGVYPGVNGLKIAYTEEAGYSTIVTATRDTISAVAIVSGTDSYLERDRAAADLLDAAFLVEGLKPTSVKTGDLNLHYKKWGDLARKIKVELKELEKNQ